MKKLFPISIATVVVVGLAGFIFAQTGGATTVLTMVEKMKAASHDFTLTTELNTGQTDLKSGPLTGKKTGGIVTAEEYNRILEILSEEHNSGDTGGSASCSTWIKAPTTLGTALDPMPMGLCRFTAQGTGFATDTYYGNVFQNNHANGNPGSGDVWSCGVENAGGPNYLTWMNQDKTGTTYTGVALTSTTDYGFEYCVGGVGGTGISTQIIKEICPTGTTSGCIANCPTGTTVVGGGVEWLSTNGTCHVATSYPKDNGWMGSTSATNSGTTSCGAAVHAICINGSNEGAQQASSWSITCAWDGWYDSRTHGGSSPTGGKGNVMSFYCKSGKLTAVKWNKGSGTVNTDLTSGVNCNFDGTQAMDPQDFDGGSDEYMIACSGGYLTGIRVRVNSWAAGASVTPGDQPTCTRSLRFWSRGIGYTCTDGKVTAISNS